MKLYGIYGASGCGRGVMPLARQQLEKTCDANWDLVFIDDDSKFKKVNGYRSLTYSQWLNEKADVHFVSIAIANGSTRERLVSQCRDDKVNFFEIRAANVVELDEVQIGEGAILCSFVTLTSNIRIGNHFHANLYSYVEHDCVIGNYVTFAPGVHCNGNVIIEDYAYLGAGALIKQGKPSSPLTIGRGAVIGMGAVVTESVLPFTTVIGNPARAMQNRN